MERRVITINGIVQGVGFRPFVYGLALRMNLMGFVKNQTGSVLIDVEGDIDNLDSFINELRKRPPPLAHVDSMDCQAHPVLGQTRFAIENSEINSSDEISICPDIAACDSCLAELFDPHDRRYRYPFINCTNCGPRLSIVTGAPYDREQTTMAPFRMCAACKKEYDDPTDRRFHAQPVACPRCGPSLQALDGAGDSLDSADPLGCFISALRLGNIGALKGVGGYHLVCDASNESAVKKLRERKHRDAKPFAIMVPSLAEAVELCEISKAERELLISVRRPVVLLHRRESIPLADEVAPGNPYLGVMLPYTPLHHLLLHDIGLPLVMTSGNRSDEPIAYQDHDLRERLGGIADLFLIHNRAIHVRCDDSVTRIIGRIESPIRRSRGYAPLPVRLPIACPNPILAVGGQMKSTFALGRGRQAILSQHMGDLDHFEASRAFERDVALYEQLFSLRPTAIAHDSHPNYASTQYAQRRATAEKIPLIAVQHHHAHMTSCMAEHGLTQPVIGVVWDGTGLGDDGAIWGGEILIGDAFRFRRAAHFRYVRLPGGEQAVREPWRMAAAYLLDANVQYPSLERRIPRDSLRLIRQLIERGFNSPWTSSAGRLFDAVASILALHDYVSYEGQAAIQLEWLASSVAADRSYPFEIVEEGAPDSPLVIDIRRTIRGITDDLNSASDAQSISRRFHSTLVEIISKACGMIRVKCGFSSVVLSGGVFMNALLTQETGKRLNEEGFQVYRHRKVPPNDGGISLGQVAIAATQLSRASV